MSTANFTSRGNTGVPSQEYKDGWDRIFGQKRDKKCKHKWYFEAYVGVNKGREMYRCSKCGDYEIHDMSSQ